MRNLKKFLALVLAMMMVFGLMVTANAADTVKSYDEFTDAGSGTAKYQEAMEVIIDLGVLQGYGGSDLMVPDGNLSRAELAAILYRIGTGNVITAQENDDDELALMAEYSRFNDVDPATGKWYVKYVNYAAWKGWLNGYDNVRFGPDDSLTTVQMLTAVMRVMGIKVTDTGNWEMDTIQAAYDNKLVTNLELSEIRAPKATREQIAQVALTALTTSTAKVEKWEVEVVSSNVDKATVEAGNPYDTRNLAVTAALDSAKELGKTATINVDFLVESVFVDDNESTLGYDSFRLKKEPNGKDEYGNPATVYTKNGDVLVSVAKSLVIDFDMPVTGADLQDALGLDGVIKTVEVVSADSSLDGKTYDKTPAGYSVVDDSKLNTKTFGGNGVHVEIYATDKEDEYKAIVTVPVLTQVTKIDKKDATITTGAYTAYTLTNIGIKDKYTTSVSGKEKTTIDIDDSVEEDDYVIVTVEHGEWDVFVVTPVNTIEGVITGYSNSTGKYTIGGKTYAVSGISNLTGKKMEMNGTSRVIAVDGEENVIAVIDEAATGETDEDNYIFAMAAEKVETVVNSRIVRTVEVSGVNQNGEWITITVSNVYNDNGNKDWSTSDKAGSFTGFNDDLAAQVSSNKQPALYVYVESDDNDGAYDLYNKAALAKGDDDQKAVAGTITDSSITVNASTDLATGLYAGSSTKYYVAKYDKDKITWTGVTPYTGYAAIGDVEDDISDADASVYAIDTDGDTIANVVFIGNFEPSASTNYAYITGAYERDAKGAYLYEIIVGGQTDTLKLSDQITDIPLPAMVTLTDTEYALVETSSATLASWFTGSSMADFIDLNNKDTFTYNGGNLMKDKSGSETPATRIAAISANVPVYIIKGGKVTVTTASKLSKSGGPTIIFAVDNDDDTGASPNGSQIIAVYIVEDAVASLNGATVSSAKEVPSVRKGESVTVSGGTLTVKNGIERDATVTTTDVTKIKLGEGATCDEAIEYTGTSAKPSEAQDGMIFKTNNGSYFKDKDGNAVSASDRTEYCFVFSVPAAAVDATTEKASVTITLTKGTTVLKDTDDEVTAGKHFWLVCPDELNDGDEAHNNFVKGNSTTPIAKDSDDNKLTAGYWTVSIDTGDTNLFKGGFTVPETGSED